MYDVAVLALDGVVPFDLGVACEVFGCLVTDGEDARYRLCVCTPDGGPVVTSLGFAVHGDADLNALTRAALIIVPGLDGFDATLADSVAGALQAAHARDATIASICTGAFVLAAAGLLDGRPATTHWRHTSLLTQRYPRVRVDPRPLYIDDGSILTSAGLAAGIDLCLHLVRRAYGASAANAIARHMVVAPHRSGGQAQYIERPVPRDASDDLEATRGWMLDRIALPLSVEAMAAHAALSPRTFARRFRAETGTTPLQWLLDQRVLLAQGLLECGDESVEAVAMHCGFGSALSLRQHFKRLTGTPPQAYRQTFRGGRGSAR